MAGDSSGSNKRKRPTSGRKDSAAPPRKTSRSSNGQLTSSDAKQHSRKVIRTMYKRFNVLSNPDSDGQSSAFEALIDSCEGDPAARRLAARLLPRFAHRFPEKLDAAARALMDISAWDGSGLNPSLQHIADATRLDALLGLSEVCTSAAAKKTDSRTSSSIILHLLRRSQQSRGRARRPCSVTEQECIQRSLMQILIGNPRAILSACFESLSYNSGELYDAAMDTIRSFLKEGMQRRNGDSRSHDWEENVMQKATMNHPKLAEWLPTAVSLQKGKSRNAETIELLDLLLQNTQKRLPQRAVSSLELQQQPDSDPLALALISRSPTSDSRIPLLNSQIPDMTPGDGRTEMASTLPTQAVQTKEKEQLNSADPGGTPRLPVNPSLEPQEEKSDFARRGSSPKPRGGKGAHGRPPSAVPSRVVLNGLHRVESGELPADTIASTPAAAPTAEPQHAIAPPPRRQPSSLELPKQGNPCCLTFECLFISGFQTDIVGEAQIRRECEEYGPVRLVKVLSPRPQAVVWFTDLSHAIACYEGLNGQVRLARRPLDVQFCEDSHEANPRNETPARTTLWLLRPPYRNKGIDGIMRDLLDAGVEQPVKVLEVAGLMPGLLLQFSSGVMALEALKVLKSWRAQAVGPSPPRRRSPTPSIATRRSPSRRTPPWKAPERLERGDLPEYASRTLWIGQVGPEIDERELIHAFERHGRVVSYKLLRGSMCGFIDFERIEDAASARSGLHEAKFADCEIRVEYKEEGRALGRLGQAPTHRGRGARGFRGGPGRGRGRFSDFDSREYAPRGSRPHFRESPPPPSSAYRGRGRGFFGRGRGPGPGERSDFPYSPRRGRSRSPRRSALSSPNGRPWSPSRSPVRLRREVRGRYGAGYVPPTRSPYRRNPSSEPSRRDRSSSREAPVGRQPSVAAQRERAQMDVDTSQQKGFLGIPQQKGDAPMEWSPTAGQTQPPNNEMPSEPDRNSSGRNPPMPSELLPQSNPPNIEPKPRHPLPPPPAQSSVSLASEPQREGIPSSTPTWSGRLGKSGSIVCQIQCLEGPRSGVGGANGLEPLNWPATLDVTLRIDIKYVLQIVSLNQGVMGNLSAVRRLTLAPDPQQSDSEARGRAGVVQKIPSAAGLEERTMYLIPPSEAVALSLKIEWKPQPLMLLAFIVPANLK